MYQKPTVKKKAMALEHYHESQNNEDARFLLSPALGIIASTLGRKMSSMNGRQRNENIGNDMLVCVENTSESTTV